MDSSGINENPIFRIVPSDGPVTINGQRFTIRGVPFRIIVSIGREAPDVLSFFFGGKITISTLLETSPGAVERIIAAGFGAIDDPAVMKFAGDMELDTQLELVAAILTKTTGGGAGPFVEKLRAVQIALAGPIVAAATMSGEAPATEATKGNGRMRMREEVPYPNDSPPLPPESNSSLPTAE
jgi:hypothetical protein